MTLMMARLIANSSRETQDGLPQTILRTEKWRNMMDSHIEKRQNIRKLETRPDLGRAIQTLRGTKLND
jgi:hypothetical protein